jgi:hypothetical protein
MAGTAAQRKADGRADGRRAVPDAARQHLLTLAVASLFRSCAPPRGHLPETWPTRPDQL